MPKSRGRKKPSKKQPRGRLHAVPDQASVLREVFEQFGQAAADADPLGAEMLVSMFCGHGWKAGELGEEDLEPLGALVEQTRRRPGTAAALALARATDQTWQPEVSPDFAGLRALALARLRALPEPSPLAEPAEISEGAREQVVREFLASPEAADLPSGDSLEYCARLIVDYGADYDGAKVLRVSPVKIEIFLLGWLPKKAVLDPEDRAMMQRMMPAWISWAGSRQGLSSAALDEVLQVARTCAGQFDETYDENVPVGRALLAGLSEVEGIDDLQDAIERRMFAMPYFGTHVGDDDFPELDPNDPDERGILIEGEHPEYHDALADPGFEGEVDGVNPRLHLVMHEIVANQMWDNDPPETWQAARRLRDLGQDRHNILHAIGYVAMTQLHGSLMGEKAFDSERYAAELDQLGRDTIN
ncbi:DUF1841 family protein [Streptomyces sp. SID13031]|uniref:DUF1841 family protein n=1 Tax=Streptomyces sp. SID13031 TaxID=2706046 RepID=UPI0013CD5205|nr:DUF1841 family protein [Streptomyces sp. SID13031]NEA30104.1 DUF1841 family protein [Streptomyces sp. SID13031]